MTLQRQSFCKINLLLNILGKRPDGFHELETVLQPVNLFDELTFATASSGIQLTCSEPALPVDERNLVYRAAVLFLDRSGIREGLKIHLHKRIPMAAGLGGGSGNAAATLLALDELFDRPLSATPLHEIAAALGSDVPFFLQNRPALATGRGERIEPLNPFPALAQAWLLLVHPGFGISTAWAYQQLARFPEALNGKTGRARALIERLQGPDLNPAGELFYNSLEAPALRKYPLLVLLQDFLRGQGGVAAMMSGSGSTTFALFSERKSAEAAGEGLNARFGPCWTAVVGI